MTTHSIDDVNRWDYDEFIERLGGVVEHFAPLMAGLWSRRPFDSLGDLHAKMCTLMNDLPFEGEPTVQCSRSKQPLSCFACATPLTPVAASEQVDWVSHVRSFWYHVVRRIEDNIT